MEALVSSPRSSVPINRLRNQVLALLQADALERVQPIKKLSTNEALKEVDKLYSLPRHELSRAQDVMVALDIALLRHRLRNTQLRALRHDETSTGMDTATAIQIEEEEEEEEEEETKISFEVAPAVPGPLLRSANYDDMDMGKASSGLVRKDAEGSEEEVDVEEAKEGVEEALVAGSLPEACLSSASASASSSLSPRSSASGSDEQSIDASVSPSSESTGDSSVDSFDGDAAIAQLQIKEEKRGLNDVEAASSPQPLESCDKEGDSLTVREYVVSCRATYALAKYRRLKSGSRCAWKTGVVVAGRNESDLASLYCVQIGRLEVELYIRGSSVEGGVGSSDSREGFRFMVVCEGDQIRRFVAPSERDCGAWVKGCLATRKEGSELNASLGFNGKSRDQAMFKWWPSAVVEGLVYECSTDSELVKTLRFARVVQIHGKLKLQVFATSEVELVDESAEGADSYSWAKKSFKFTFDLSRLHQKHVVRMGTYLVMQSSADCPGEDMQVAPLLPGQLQKVLDEHEDCAASGKSEREREANEESHGSDEGDSDNFSFDADLPIQVLPLKDNITNHSFYEEQRSSARPLATAGEAKGSFENTGLVHGPVTDDETTIEATAEDSRVDVNFPIEVDESDRQMCDLREELLRQIKGLRHKRVMKKNGESFVDGNTPRLTPLKNTVRSKDPTHLAPTLEPERASTAVVERLQRTMQTAPRNEYISSRGPRRLASDLLSISSPNANLKAAPKTPSDGSQTVEFLMSPVNQLNFSHAQDETRLSHASCAKQKQNVIATDDDEEFEDCVEAESPLDYRRTNSRLVSSPLARGDEASERSAWVMVCPRGQTFRKCEFYIGESVLKANRMLKCSFADNNMDTLLLNLSEATIVRHEPSSCLLNALVASGSNDEDICARSMTNSFKIIVTSWTNVVHAYEFYFQGDLTKVDSFIEQLKPCGYD